MDKLKIPDSETNIGLRVAVLEMVVRALVIARADSDGKLFIPFDDETVAEYKRVHGNGSWLQLCDQLENQCGLPVVTQ